MVWYFDLKFELGCCAPLWGVNGWTILANVIQGGDEVQACQESADAVSHVRICCAARAGVQQGTSISKSLCLPSLLDAIADLDIRQGFLNNVVCEQCTRSSYA